MPGKNSIPLARYATDSQINKRILEAIPSAMKDMMRESVLLGEVKKRKYDGYFACPKSKYSGT